MNTHTLALSIVHREAARTLSKGDFDLCMRIAKRALDSDRNLQDDRRLPDHLTPPLRDVLGLMLWQTVPIANALRAAGTSVEPKAEAEQAVALHWLLGFAIKDGTDWQKTAAVALRKLTDSAHQTGNRST